MRGEATTLNLRRKILDNISGAEGLKKPKKKLKNLVSSSGRRQQVYDPYVLIIFTSSESVKLGGESSEPFTRKAQCTHGAAVVKCGVS
jgi:hypothetical protein